MLFNYFSYKILDRIVRKMVAKLDLLISGEANSNIESDINEKHCETFASQCFVFWQDLPLCLVVRKRGDSNPRYGYPYVSLANWWFQPLTHTSLICGFSNFLSELQVQI